MPTLRLLLLAGALLCGAVPAQTPVAGKVRYVCPPCGVDCHHQDYPDPGACPHCGMKLVPAHTVPHVAILTFDRIDLLSFAGPAGVLQTAHAAHVFSVADTDEAVRAQDFQTVVPQHSTRSCPRVDVLVLPDGSGVASVAGDQLMLDWIGRTARQARCVLAIGSAVVLLARAGVLGEETVVAGARDAALVSAGAPKCKVVTDRPTAESGRIFTALHAAGAIQQALHIVHALKDERRARQIATRLGVEWQPKPDRGPLPPAAQGAPPQAEATRREPPQPPAGGASTTPRRGGDTAPDGQDWPQWRGPRRDGVSRERGWVDRGAAAPLWRAEVGFGHSGVVVTGEHAFVVGFDQEAERDVVRCLDTATGAEVWTHSYPAKLNPRGHGGGSLTTPAVQGGRVFVSHRTGELRCLDARTGDLVWHRKVAADLGLEGTEYGFGASPLVLGDLVVYEVAAVVALRAATGEVAWRTRDLKAMYSTPTPFEHAGAARLAAFTKEGLYVLARADGEELGFYPFRKGPSTVNAASPVVAGDRLFISSAYDHGCALLQVEAAGLRALWQSRAMRTRLSGCVLHEGHLYGFDEATLKCIDLDGHETWRKRHLGMGALTIAGDRLVVLGARGDLVVADASPAGFRERSRRKVFDAGVCWTSPTVAHGRIYCRNSHGTLVCLDHRPR